MLQTVENPHSGLNPPPAPAARTRCKSMLLALALGTMTASLPASAASTHSGALPWSYAQQMVLVIVPDWKTTKGTLRTYARSNGAWHAVGKAHPVVIGHGGTGWGLGLNPPQSGGPVKREGDGRSPAGVFAIGRAFGYAPDADTALRYSQMKSTSSCVDVSGSPLYNHIVDAAKVGTAAVEGATEHMRLDLHNHGDQRYRRGFVIEHNTQGKPMGGSCIFAHLWGSPDSTTTGCTAMAPATMRELYGWLEPRLHPVFVLLPQKQYLRLRASWNLPKTEKTP